MNRFEGVVLEAVSVLAYTLGCLPDFVGGMVKVLIGTMTNDLFYYKVGVVLVRIGPVVFTLVVFKLGFSLRLFLHVEWCL